MKTNNIILIILILFLSVIYSNENILVVTFYDYDTGTPIKKDISYKIKDSNGEILKKGKLKRNKKKHKIKYDVEADFENVFNGMYTVVFP